MLSIDFLVETGTLHSSLIKCQMNTNPDNHDLSAIGPSSGKKLCFLRKVISSAPNLNNWVSTLS